jgi:hypothetical protein
MKVLHLVDDVIYAMSNCYQHQLMHALGETGHNIITRSLNDLLWGGCYSDNPDVVVSCLKQRTLNKNAQLIACRLKQGIPFSAYDQDPWESFKRSSPHLGSYANIRKYIPQVRFCITTPWWERYLTSWGYTASVVPMGMLPSYCTSTPAWVDRRIPVGFYGTLHPHRKRLTDSLEANGIPVHRTKEPNYDLFMDLLSDTQIFVHSEDEELDLIDGSRSNMSYGMWVKDVEAAARGCWSVRNSADTYGCLDGIETVLLYKNVEEAHSVVLFIQQMDAAERQSRIDRTVEFIRSSHKWKETATALVEGSQALSTAP